MLLPGICNWSITVHLFIYRCDCVNYVNYVWIMRTMCELCWLTVFAWWITFADWSYRHKSSTSLVPDASFLFIDENHHSHSLLNSVFYDGIQLLRNLRSIWNFSTTEHITEHFLLDRDVSDFSQTVSAKFVFIQLQTDVFLWVVARIVQVLVFDNTNAKPVVVADGASPYFCF